jgi:hypothetical protein
LNKIGTISFLKKLAVMMSMTAALLLHAEKTVNGKGLSASGNCKSLAKLSEV